MLNYTVTTRIDGLSTIFEFFVNRKSVAYIIRVGQSFLVCCQQGYSVIVGVKNELIKEV